MSNRYAVRWTTDSGDIVQSEWFDSVEEAFALFNELVQTPGYIHPMILRDPPRNRFVQVRPQEPSALAGAEAMEDEPKLDAENHGDCKPDAVV